MVIVNRGLLTQYHMNEPSILVAGSLL